MEPTEEEIRRLVSHQSDVLELMKYGINREVAMGYVAEVSRLIQSISIVAIAETLDTEAEELPKVMKEAGLSDAEITQQVEGIVEPEPRVRKPITKGQLCVELWNEGNKDVLWLTNKLDTTEEYIKRKLKQAGINYTVGMPPTSAAHRDGSGGGTQYTDEERLGYVLRIEERVRKGTPKFRALSEVGISSGCYNRWKHWIESGRLDSTKEQYSVITGADWVESRKKSGWTKNSPLLKKNASGGVNPNSTRWKRWPNDTREAIMKEWAKKRNRGVSIKKLEAFFTEKYGRLVVSGTVYAWFSKKGIQPRPPTKREKRIAKDVKKTVHDAEEMVSKMVKDSEPTPVEPEPIVTKPEVDATPPNSVQSKNSEKETKGGGIEISVLSRETVSTMHNQVLLANAVFLRAKKEKGLTWRDDIIASVATVKKAVDGYDKQLENEGYYVLAHRPDGMKALKQLKNIAKVAKEIYRAMTDTGNK